MSRYPIFEAFPSLPACRVLLGYKPMRRRKITTAPEGGQVRGECLDRICKELEMGRPSGCDQSMLCIGHIVLLTFDEGLYVGRWD